MTCQQKQQIYNLLKTAADSVLGFRVKSFDTTPVFYDDPLPAPQNLQEQTDLHEPSLAAPLEAPPAASSDHSSLDFSTVHSSLEDSICNLKNQISACSRCALAKTRNNTVPGTGSLKPVVLVVGEGPGFEEDRQGLPFVGPAGQLLDKMLAAISLSRISNTYIANIVKCRPPQNRDPYPEEAEACSSFLQAQIALLKPKAILCVGSVAAKNLLKTEAGVSRLRGNFYQYHNIPVAVTYHPSALLRSQDLKRPAWEDLKQFRLKLLELCPDYESSCQPYVSH